MCHSKSNSASTVTRVNDTLHYTLYKYYERWRGSNGRNVAEELPASDETSPSPSHFSHCRSVTHITPVDHSMKSPTEEAGPGDCLDDAIPYEKLQPGKPPIPIIVARRPSSARLSHPLMRPENSPEPSLSESPVDSHTTPPTDLESTASLKNTLGSPLQTLQTDGHGKVALSPFLKIRKWSGQKIPLSKETVETPAVSVGPFLGITTSVPNSSFDNLTSPDHVQFSNRGSMLIGGKRANETNGRVGHQSRPSAGRRQLASSNSTPSVAVTSVRVLSMDDEMESRKVRSMYDVGVEYDTSMNNLRPMSSAVDEDAKVQDTQNLPNPDANLPVPSLFMQNLNASRTTLNSRTGSSIRREDHELAGGIEDWEDINGEDIDRYGFIVPRVLSANISLPIVPPERTSLQRCSSSLQLASEAPRRQHSKLGRSTSVSRSVRLTTSRLSGRRLSQRRPPSSRGSYQSSTSRSISRIRSVANRLPYNRERRCVDEAGDMLTLPPGLADIAENEEGGKAANEAKRREWEREDKWKKMAKLARSNRDGGGMVFEFDTRSPKLISRTWKGIPDRWRATAWHAFLTASAKKQSESLSDHEIINVFHELIEQSSPDDVQIDIDVPRTISSHIMFRKRYRGGQRLLFRVLHCMSIHFPDTGYVQGMAALAATMLCYYDEEMAFVMLVRMWQLRGVARLYQSGFEGLMEALDEFEKNWLVGSEVAKKLVSPYLFYDMLAS